MGNAAFSKRQYVCCGVSAFFLAVGVALIVAGIVMLVKVVPDTIRSQVKKNKVIGKLDDGSYNSLTRSWMSPSYVTRMQYWIYNYTNTYEIQHRGALPDPIEKGPYSYREIQKNEIEGFSDDFSQVYYRPRSVFIFDKESSCSTCDPNDVVLVPDIIFFRLFNMLMDVEQLQAYLCELLPLACSLPLSGLEGVIANYSDYIALAMKAMDAGPFVYTTVDELLFRGYDDPIFTNVIAFLLKALQAFVPSMSGQIPLNLEAPKAFLNSKNNTPGMLYTMRTGKDSAEDGGQIIALYDSDNSTFNSDGNLLSDTWWNNPDEETCPSDLNVLARRINGSLADIFKPFVKKTDRLYSYVPDICRSIYFLFKKEVKVKGLTGYRFVIPDEVFNYSRSENCGFCHKIGFDMYSKKKDDFCLPDGVLDISQCTPQNPPIAVSNPHFLAAAKEINDMYPRLRPDAEVHQTTIDIEPTMGVVLRANKRLQINLMVNRFNTTKAYNVYLSGIYPMAWVNESFLIDDQSVDDLNSQLIKPRRLARILCWVIGIGFGAACVIFSLILFASLFFCAQADRVGAALTEIQRAPNATRASDELTTVRRRVVGSSEVRKN